MVCYFLRGSEDVGLLVVVLEIMYYLNWFR